MRHKFKTMPLAFLLGVTLFTVGASHVSAGNLSDRLDSAEAKIATMDCKTDEQTQQQRKQANEAILREYFRLFGEVDILGAAKLWHEDIVMHFPTNPLVPHKLVGKDAAVRHYIEGFAAEAEGGSVTGKIKWLKHIQGQDAILFEYNEKAELKDGNTFELDAVAFVRFRDGKMSYYEEWFDPMPFLTAIGMNPLAENH